MSDITHNSEPLQVHFGVTTDDGPHKLLKAIQSVPELEGRPVPLFSHNWRTFLGDPSASNNHGPARAQVTAANADAIIGAILGAPKLRELLVPNYSPEYDGVLFRVTREDGTYLFDVTESDI